MVFQPSSRPAESTTTIKCFCAAIALFVVGCGSSGPKTYPVKGTVSYQGKPLPLGAIMFVPEDGPTASAAIQSDGTYQVDLIAGAHRVQVVAIPPRQGKPDPYAEGGLDTTGFPEPKPLVPAKYNRYDTSEVQIDVNPSGENNVNIDLP